MSGVYWIDVSWEEAKVCARIQGLYPADHVVVVERCCRDLIDHDLTARLVGSVPDRVGTIPECLDAGNDEQKPFASIVSAEDILAKIARGRVAVETVINKN